MIKISIRKTVTFLVTVLIILTIFDLLFFYTNHFYYDNSIIIFLYKLFNTNFEANIPTYFSVFLIMFNSVILAVIGKNENKKATFWYFLSVLFFIASIDELAQIHENVDMLIRANTAINNLFQFGWVNLWFIFVLAVVLVTIKFIASLPKTTRNTIIIAGAVYVIGALVFEVIGGHCPDSGTCYAACTTIEEFLEMSGMIIFAYAFLDYLSVLKPKFDVKVIK